MNPIERPPSLRRLLERIALLPGPVVQLWSWPGGGGRAVLSALAADRQGVWIDDAKSLPVLRGTEGRLALWAGEGPPPPLLLAQLPPGGRCLWAGARRQQQEAPGAVVFPTEMLLSETEVALLAKSLTLEGVSPELARRLCWATDGWFEPLAIALSAGVGRGRFDPTPAALLSLPGVRSFLRTEVWDPLASTLGELLLEIAVPGSVDAGFWLDQWWEQEPQREVLLGEIVEEWGLWLDEGQGRRLPLLLQAFLIDERERSWPPARSFARSHRAAVSAYGLGSPTLAVAALAAAGDVVRVGLLLSLEWLELLLRCDLPSLRTALRVARGRSSPGAELLELTLEAVSGERRRAVVGLAELAARTDEPRLSAACRLVLASLRGARASFEVAAAVRSHLQPAASPSAALDALIALIEGRRVEAPPGGLSPSDPLIVHLLTFAGSGAARAASAGPATQAPTRQRAQAEQTFHARFFGDPRVFRLEAGQRQELRWTLRRSLKMFSFLASQPDLSASRNQLIEAIWGDEPEEAIERNFHPTLTHLRRSLALPSGGAPPLLLVAGTYRLNPDFDWLVDAAEFESLAQRGRQRLAAGDADAAAELWQAAWRLYGGPFLDSCEEPWVLSRRELLEQTYLQVLQGLGEIHQERGHNEPAMDAFRAALVIDPLQERVHLEVMRLYARQGRRDLVRHQYDRLSTILRQELGVEPLAETTAQFHRLMG
ncbi:MAG TPA: BTAD domain-containing putative transcriptional regulator [Thermoanaerobaculia bacterium]|nr:BTAD domain-containing putative transcriptional regulator [Thermoanaerobaculia bacterium]